MLNSQLPCQWPKKMSLINCKKHLPLLTCPEWRRTRWAALRVPRLTAPCTPACRHWGPWWGRRPSPVAGRPGFPAPAPLLPNPADRNTDLLWKNKKTKNNKTPQKTKYWKKLGRVTDVPPAPGWCCRTAGWLHPEAALLLQGPPGLCLSLRSQPSASSAQRKATWTHVHL